jgi:hypothetical protein
MQVERCSFTEHLHRRLRDVVADVFHRLRTLAISCGVFAPSEEKRQRTRGKWRMQAPVAVKNPLAFSSQVTAPPRSSMVSTGAVLLDLYREKSSSGKPSVSSVNGDIIMF